MNFPDALPCILALLTIFFLHSDLVANQGQGPPVPVRVWADSITLPTSVEGIPDPSPPFDFFGTGRFVNYPYALRHNLVDRRTPRKWRTLNLENEYLKCTVLPDLGGHLYTCIDKINGTSMFYANPSIKFARIAYRGMWAALGVEFNFPVSHNWMTVSPVDFATSQEADGSASIWMGNIDRVDGMQWLVHLILRPGEARLEQRTTLSNWSDTRHRFYWWTNAGVQVWDDSRILYPMEFTAAHGFADIDTWPVNSAGEDLSVVGNHKNGPVSRFSYGSREPYMAVYHPHTDSGIVHYSSPLDLPAKKIWSWGSDDDGLDWRHALSDNDSAYIEVQAGLFRDQETYGFLNPEETRSFTEYWIPIRQLGGVSYASTEAVVNLGRRNHKANTVLLDIAMNVIRSVPNATVRILSDTTEVASIQATISPAQTFRKSFAGMPANATYTIELRNESGEILLRYTEGKYDVISRNQVQFGEQPTHKFPPDISRGADDFLAIGTDQESNGELLIALRTYRQGLERFPESIALNRAAGRLEVSLSQYGLAADHLSKALAWTNSDHETAYYLGLALAGQGELREARTQWEFAQQSASYHAPALIQLSALEARAGDRHSALRMIQRVLSSRPDLTHAGGIEVALLRSLQRSTEANERLAFWMRKDPTDSFLRYEGTRLGHSDPDLFGHLATDPERIIELATSYMQFGLYEDALDVLARRYPSEPGVIGEPGVLPSGLYPLIAYYRGFCRHALGQDDLRDFTAASKMPTSYVFPNRTELFAVLQRAKEVNSQDATAHFLLGSLFLSKGLPDRALEEWQIARRLNPAIPTLHRNMGYTILRSGGSTNAAIDLFHEGMRYDSHNVDIYLGLEESLEKSGRPVSERIRALQAFPELPSAPAVLVFRLVSLLVDTGDFAEAEKLLANRFFPREEGGADVREIYVTLRLKQAQGMAAQAQCPSALDIIRSLSESVPNLPFTTKGLEPFLLSTSSKQAIAEIQALCH